jgi:nicotinamide mononucleotide (NMN) deamidase PncC
VAIRFFEDRSADIGVSYVGLAGPKDGSNGFIGFSMRSGGVFTLGNHEAVVQNESSLIFRAGL